MVSFNCNKCGDVVKKPKVQSHAAQCGTGGYSCVDCMVQFDLNTIANHRECVSETTKYQGKWQEKKLTIRASAEGAAPRPKFSTNDFDDTDMDDDAPVKKTVPAAASAEFRGRIRMVSSSDDDDDAAPAPKAKAAAATPAPTKKAISAKASPAAAPKTAGKKVASPMAAPRKTHVAEVPVMASAKSLPKAIGTVIVNDFELGEVEEVAEMCAGVLAAHGATEMPLKDVVAQLASEVYAKRIQKKVLAALSEHLSGKAPLKGVTFDAKTVRTA
jgi:cell growth-regulating nucleolar protein